MNRKPISVKELGKQRDYYKIAFPNLKIPVEVDEDLYRKMLQSPEYQFQTDSDNRLPNMVAENRLAK